MGAENEPAMTEPVEAETTTTNPTEIDPKIDPNVLVEQSGPNMGTIATPELVLNAGRPGEEEMTYDPDRNPQEKLAYPGISVGGLPLIGAQAEREARDEVENRESLPGDIWQDIRERIDNSYDTEEYYDAAGTEAMAAEVKNRAIEIAKKNYPIGSSELVEQYGQKAADLFKKKMETKTAERKAEQDEGLRAMIASLDAPDAQLPPGLVPEEPKSEEVPYTPKDHEFEPASEAAKAFEHDRPKPFDSD